MPRVVRKKLDRKVKTYIQRRVLTEKQGAKKSSDTVRFYPLPWVVAVICELSSGPKWLYAKLNFDAWGRDWCRVGVGSLAKTLGVDRETIQQWLTKLERFGLIRVVHERACCIYYLIPKYRAGGFIPLLAETMKRRDIGWVDKMVLCSLSYRQAGNDYCWAMQKAQAADLGVSVRTIQRVLAGMKARGEVQIRLRRRNRKQGNKYALTCGAVLGGRIFGANSHTTEYPHLYKKWKAKSYFKALRPEFLSGDLSARSSRDGFGLEAVFFELVGCGIHEKVARPLAFDDKHPFSSVVQAINNAQILRAAVFKRSDDAGLPRPNFNLPGYVVRALNGARREGKVVGTTKLFRSAAALSRAIKIAKARRGRWRPLSDPEFDRRRRAAKRALGLPA
jgi:DNA-binding MarR family transcriptional regulator